MKDYLELNLWGKFMKLKYESKYGTKNKKIEEANATTIKIMLAIYDVNSIGQLIEDKQFKWDLRDYFFVPDSIIFAPEYVGLKKDQAGFMMIKGDRAYGVIFSHLGDRSDDNLFTLVKESLIHRVK